MFEISKISKKILKNQINFSNFKILKAFASEVKLNMESPETLDNETSSLLNKEKSISLKDVSTNKKDKPKSKFRQINEFFGNISTPDIVIINILSYIT